VRRLIVTGDDFGRSQDVNAAIETAHQNGILSAASLMVAEEAAQDAVARAKRLPGLRVGLHIAVVRARGLTPPGGRLSDRQIAASLAIAFSPRARRDLAREIEAQFEAFARTGLALDHVNGHCHMHLHPVVRDLILTIGPRYGMKAMRMVVPPRRSHAGAGARIEQFVIAHWSAAMRQRLDDLHLASNDRLFGLAETGRMSADALLGILEQLPDGVSEIYCHPGGDGGRLETGALCDPRVKAQLRDLGLVPCGFADISGAGA